MYLRATLSAGESESAWAWVSNVGHALIKDVYLEIGGTQIDKQYGDWMNIWYELTHKVGQERGYNRMVGNVPENTSLATSHSAYTLNIPLQFFHCRHDGLGLPLIALQYHEVRVTFDFNPLNKLVVYENGSSGNLSWTTAPILADTSLWVDYVYLDQEERKRFAQATHEYLIEQVQFPSSESVGQISTRTRLSFNHPCKFLAWVVRLGRYTSGNRFLGYDATDAAAIRLQATKRFILGYASIVSGALQVSGDFIDGNSDLSSTYLGYFDAAKAICVDTSVLDEDNITITGELLPLAVASLPADLLETAAVADRNTGSDNRGSAEYDIVVYQYDNYGCFLDRSQNPVTKALLQLNGHDRFSEREGDYFNYVQPYQCFSNTPNDGVNVYSFALTPEEHQPSGTCNFSRIDNASLNISLGVTGENNFKGNYLANDSELNIYAFNYNVLRVMSGMAGLALMIISIEQKSIMLVAFVLYYQIKHLESQISILSMEIHR
jgi:hypothetical protein